MYYATKYWPQNFQYIFLRFSRPGMTEMVVAHLAISETLMFYPTTITFTFSERTENELFRNA